MYGKFNRQLDGFGFVAPVRSLRKAVTAARAGATPTRTAPVAPPPMVSMPTPSTPLKKTALPFTQERMTHEQLMRLRQEAKYKGELTDRYEYEDGDGYATELEAEALTENAVQSAIDDAGTGTGLPENGAPIVVEPEKPNAIPLLGLGALAWFLLS